MGYWSEHPLGGDQPTDDKCDLCQEIFEIKCCDEEDDNDEDSGIENDECNFILTEESLTKFVKNMKDDEDIESDFGCFIIPFLVAEQELRITDKKLSKKIKSLIQDGNAGNRGYDVPYRKSKKFPTKENNYNNLESPFDYARQLYDNWDGLMDGTISFDILGQCPGLFEAIEDHKDKEGLVNVN